MKSTFVCALAIAAFVSLAGASLADAHYLSGGKAYRIAARDSAYTAREIGNRSGYRVEWAVRNPCSYRNAHRWICDGAFRATVDGVRRVCTFKIIVRFASRTSYAIRTKAVGSNCFND